MVLTEHNAIISALKTNRGNKTHQSRLTRWADRLLPFDFDIFHISGCKLGIVDYLSRFPTFEAPRPSSFDEQYVVKCNSRFFDACDFLDEWATCCLLLEESPIIRRDRLESPNITKNSQNSAVSNTINLIESLDFGQPRVNRSIVASNKFGSLSVEGAIIQNIPATSQGIKSIEGAIIKNIPATSQGIKSIEGDKNLDSKHFGISQQFNTFVISPLGGVKIAGLKSSQSALRKIMQVFVTFSAWITYYLPVFISVWIITLAVSDCDLLLSFIDFFAYVSSYRICWNAIVLLGVFHFQTAMDSNTITTNTNDSFEQLLNQYLPVNQHWFSSDRARPRFRAGAVRPRRLSTLQRGVELRSQYARILANFRTKRARKTTLTNRQPQSVHSLENLKSPVVAKDQKSLTGLVGILDSDVLSELTDEDASLCLMKRTIINQDYEGLCRIDSYIKSFWHCAAVVDGCIVVDNRIAIPMCLRKPLLSRLHRSHAGQLAMVDAAQYIWWPQMHRDIVQFCKDCPQCTKFGKNLKANASFNSSKPLPLLFGPNEELQLDYAGPLLDSFGNSIYILVAIDC